LHSLDDCTTVLEHLDENLLHVAVPVVKLVNVELVEDSDLETLQDSWGVNVGVGDALNVPDGPELSEVNTVGVMLILALHDIKEGVHIID
jgi:hypothetical protein